MAGAIAFLMPVPLTEHHVRRYGLRVLEGKGVFVHIIDLSKLLNKKFFCQDYDVDSLKGIHVHRIDSYAELDKKIEELSRVAVFVDYLIGLSGIDIEHERIFRILKKHRAKYYIIADADLPVSSTAEGISKKEHLQRYARIFELRFVGRYIAKTILRMLIRYTGFYSLPTKVFGTDSEKMRSYIEKYDNGSILRIPINSSDYSAYLDYVKRKEETGHTTENTCVFLDEDAVNSYDYDILGLKKIDSKRYLSTMNRLFDKIESEMDLKVVIAAHPMSHYEELPGAFEGRKIVKDMTVDLVARSRLVVMHSSTAVSFVVLFKKPVIILKTFDMIAANRSRPIDAIANALGVDPINIDDEKQLGRISYENGKIPSERYEDYKYRYLATEDLLGLSTWDIVAREILRERLDKLPW